MLPLIKGMPVALTEHLDRNPTKNLRKGKVGDIDSWVEDEREDSAYDSEKRILRYVPRVVFVQYYDWIWSEEQQQLVKKPCSWTMPGIDRPGIYPIFPKKNTWFLDQHRNYPMLGVSRTQIPLAPAYAMTAHDAQGRTLPAAIIDLQLGRGVSTIASYVAMTRVRRRTDILIFRPFEKAEFEKGPPEGPSTLLKHLRREPIDWKEIEDRLTPKKICHGPCGLLRFKDEFGATEWKNKTDPHCKACITLDVEPSETIPKRRRTCSEGYSTNQ